MDIEQLMMEYDDPFKHNHLLHSSSKEEPTSTHNWGGFLRRPSITSNSIINAITNTTRRLSNPSINRERRPSNASANLVSRRPSSNSIANNIIERIVNATEQQRERQRRNSNVSVLSDGSVNSYDLGNNSNNNNNTSSAKRRHSLGFSPHVQLMQELMDEDC